MAVDPLSISTETSFPAGREEVSGRVPARSARELYTGRLHQHTFVPAQVLWGLHRQQVLHPLQVQNHRHLLPVSRWAWLLPPGPVD